MLVLLTFLLLPLWAQQEEDTTYLFRFVPGKDMFLSLGAETSRPWTRFYPPSLPKWNSYAEANAASALRATRPKPTKKDDPAARTRMGYLRNSPVKSE